MAAPHVTFGRPDHPEGRRTLPARVNAEHARPNYFYDKHTVREDYDGKGALKEETDKRYVVTVESGLSYLKLTQLNGKTLSPSEQKKKKQNDRGDCRTSEDD